MFATSLEKHSLKTPVEKHSLDSTRSTPLRTTRSSPGFHGFTLRRSIPFAKSLPSPQVSYEEVFPSYVSRYVSSTVNHSSAKSWFLGCLFRIRQTFCFTLRGSFELSLSLSLSLSSRSALFALLAKHDPLCIRAVPIVPLPIAKYIHLHYGKLADLHSIQGQLLQSQEVCWTHGYIKCSPKVAFVRDPSSPYHCLPSIIALRSQGIPPRRSTTPRAHRPRQRKVHR